MTKQQQGTLKIAVAVIGMIVGVASIAAYVNSGVDFRIDNKINEHEAEFEVKQQQTVTEIKEDIATLKEQSTSQQRQLDVIQDQGKHTQELVEQLLREN